MITSILFYIAIVGLLAYASYLKEHTQKKVVGDPPTPRHSVADPHAVATLIHGGTRPGPHDHAIWAYDVYSDVEANYFGKEFLRMAGIVQMLHALQPPTISIRMPTQREYDKHNDQKSNGITPSMASAIPGSCRTTRG